MTMHAAAHFPETLAARFALASTPITIAGRQLELVHPQSVEGLIRNRHVGRTFIEGQNRADRARLKYTPIREVLEGKRFVHAHCYRADEILMLIRVADDYGFKIKTFQHVLEGYKVAKEIAAHGAGGSTFSDWWAYKAEAFDAIPYNAAVMTKKGVVSSLMTCEWACLKT